MALTATMLWVNLGYGLMLAGLLARDILWLRLILMIGQACLCVAASHAGLQNAALWNALFVIINACQSVLVLRARRDVKLPDTQETVYLRHFRHMARAEFAQLWALSRRADVGDAPLLAADEINNTLYLVTSGRALVRVRDKLVAVLERGDFVAEMSFLTGETISADVCGEDGLICRAWSRADIDRLAQRHPKRWNQLQAAIGHDLVGKLRHVDSNATLMNLGQAG